MFCQECGKRHDDTAKYCPNCGTKIINIIQPGIIPEREVSVPTQEQEQLMEGKIVFSRAEDDAGESLKKPVEEADESQKTCESQYLEKDIGMHQNITQPPENIEQSNISDTYERPVQANTASGQYQDAEQKHEETHNPGAKSEGGYAIWHSLIGDNSDYYISEFRSIVSGESSFNWMAFFFAGPLMLYRKLYVSFVKYFLAFILVLFIDCFIVMFGLSTGESAYFITGVALCGLTVIYWLILSIVSGNNFNRNYFKYLQNIINKNNLTGRTQGDMSIIKKRGGTAIVPMSLILILIFAVLIGIQIFAAKFGISIKDGLGL